MQYSVSIKLPNCMVYRRLCSDPDTMLVYLHSFSYHTEDDHIIGKTHLWAQCNKSALINRSATVGLLNCTQIPHTS